MVPCTTMNLCKKFVALCCVLLFLSYSHVFSTILFNSHFIFWNAPIYLYIICTLLVQSTPFWAFPFWPNTMLWWPASTFQKKSHKQTKKQQERKGPNGNCVFCFPNFIAHTSIILSILILNIIGKPTLLFGYNHFS